jgi:hypothetical protein
LGREDQRDALKRGLPNVPGNLVMSQSINVAPSIKKEKEKEKSNCTGAPMNSS